MGTRRSTFPGLTDVLSFLPSFIMIKSVVFCLLVASALSMTLQKKGGEDEEMLTHEIFADELAKAKDNFLEMSGELKALSDQTAEANALVEESQDYSKWEEIEHQLEADLEEHSETFQEEEEKLLGFAWKLYVGHSDFAPSGTCSATHNVAKPLKDEQHVDPQAALQAIEDDIRCFSELADGAKHIPEVPDRGADGDFSDEHAFELTVNILSEVYKVRHAGIRFERAARALDSYFTMLSAGSDAADLQTKRLISLLRRVLKTMRK